VTVEAAMPGDYLAQDTDFHDAHVWPESCDFVIGFAVDTTNIQKTGRCNAVAGAIRIHGGEDPYVCSSRF
jgi:hypothetical protein